MSSLNELQILIANCESNSAFTLSEEQIEYYFDHLVKASSDSEGYRTLCWDAGVWLLLLAEDQPNIWFDRFGYLAIGNALRSAIIDGNLPDGLGWYWQGFIPPEAGGDVMLYVLSHPVIEERLKETLRNHDFVLNLDILNTSDNAICETALSFLSHLHRVDVLTSTQLMWAARIFEVIPSESHSQITAAKLVLDFLLTEERFVNAYYWFQVHFLGGEREQGLEQRVFEILSGLVELSLSDTSYSQRLLTSLLNSQNLYTLIASSNRSQALAAIAMLWLVVREQSLVNLSFAEYVSNTLWDQYPNLALFIKLITRWAAEIAEYDLGAGVTIDDYVRNWQNRSHHFDSLKDELERLRNYRNSRLPLDIWRECKESVFSTLYEALTRANTVKQFEEIRTELASIDADDLIKNTQSYSIPGRKLENNSYKMLLVDITQYLEKFKTALEYHQRVIVTQKFADRLAHEIQFISLLSECQLLLEQLPSVENYTIEYLIPIVEEWENLIFNASRTGEGVE